MKWASRMYENTFVLFQATALVVTSQQPQETNVVNRAYHASVSRRIQRRGHCVRDTGDNGMQLVRRDGVPNLAQNRLPDTLQAQKGKVGSLRATEAKSSPGFKQALKLYHL